MAVSKETELDAELRKRLVQQEIKEGQLDVETPARTILIRIREKGSFTSGSALLNTSFVGVIDKIAGALTQIEGKISVEGHTITSQLTRSRIHPIGTYQRQDR